MPVPTFTLLTEAQFDPGKPMTQEIGLALWRNPLALLGVDDTDATPAPAIPPGYYVKDRFVYINEIVVGPNGTSGTHGTAFQIADVTNICDNNTPEE